MDQIKVGQFISVLRRERGLTQEQLGELVGVTNKTVSRWETGTYMPPIEALEALSKEYGVTINEIIAGERLNDESFRVKADENISSAWQDSAFTLKERQEYFKHRWLKKHALVRYLHIILCVFLFVHGIHLNAYWLIVASTLVNIIGHTIAYNAMMSYVERKSFEKPKKEEE